MSEESSAGGRDSTANYPLTYANKTIFHSCPPSSSLYECLPATPQRQAWNGPNPKQVKSHCNLLPLWSVYSLKAYEVDIDLGMDGWMNGWTVIFG